MTTVILTLELIALIDRQETVGNPQRELAKNKRFYSLHNSQTNLCCQTLKEKKQ